MDKALTHLSNKNIVIGKFRLAECGLVISGSPTYDEWEACGTFLKQAEKAVQFWIGDWLNYGERQWGEQYSQAVEETGYDQGTLRNYKYTASAVDLSLRSDKLSFAHHREIATLEPQEQREFLDLAEEQHLSSRELREEVRKHKVKTKTPKLADGKYSVIYADPPWKYDFSQSGSREIENQYPTMDVEEICALSVGNLAAADCVLFLWATNPKLREALQTIEAWGFEYKTNMVWVKDKIGMGYYARQKHELLLIATTGSPPTPAPEDRPASAVMSERVGHSRKPQEFYGVIETMYPKSKKIELFSRAKRQGWEAWGNEV